MAPSPNRPPDQSPSARPKPQPVKPAAAPPRPHSESTALAAGARADSITASLQSLGVQLTKRHVTGFVVAVIAGLITARILPFIWGYLNPITSLFGSSRDDMNVVLMTGVTCLLTGGIAFAVFRKP